MWHNHPVTSGSSLQLSPWLLMLIADLVMSGRAWERGVQIRICQQAWRVPSRVSCLSLRAKCNGRTALCRLFTLVGASTMQAKRTQRQPSRNRANCARLPALSDEHTSMANNESCGCRFKRSRPPVECHAHAWRLERSRRRMYSNASKAYASEFIELLCRNFTGINLILQKKT